MTLFVAAYVRTYANESMSLSTQIGKVHENDDFVHLFDAASASEAASAFRACFCLNGFRKFNRINKELIKARSLSVTEEKRLLGGRQ